MLNSLLPSSFLSREPIPAENAATDGQGISCDRIARSSNRRKFLSTLGGVAAAALVGTGASARAQSTATPSATDYLNLLLNLEYLEANLYLYVTTGAGLSSANTGGSTASVTGASKLTLDATTTAVAQALAADETLHVQQLRALISSLGGTPVAQPAINLGAKTAPTTQATFITLARNLNALSSAAYTGMAPLVSALNSAAVPAAAQILGAEGQHAGVLNYLCIYYGLITPSGTTPGVNSAYMINSQDVVPTVAVTSSNTAANYFTAQATTAFSPAMFTTSEILGVAYGLISGSGAYAPLATSNQVGVVSGGYFPSGVNGNIVST